jgi:transposase InsO family protein
VCWQHGIEHRLTKVGHPWTNGQVERMNRTLKEATVHRYHYGSHAHYGRHAELRAHLAAFMLAYNHAKRLKTLKGLTPHEFVCRQWQREPERFVRDPVHETLGPYT